MIIYRELEEEMRGMTPRSQLFKLIRAEMERRGHWKQKPRGKGFERGNEWRVPKKDARTTEVERTSEPNE